MERSKRYLSIGLIVLGALGLLGGFGVGFYNYQKNKDIIFQEEYHASMGVHITKDVILSSDCVKMPAKLTITEKAVTLSVGNDTMSGIPVKVSDNGELTILVDGREHVTFTRTIPDGYERTKENQLLIMITQEMTIILTTHADCEEITALLGQIKG